MDSKLCENKPNESIPLLNSNDSDPENDDADDDSDSGDGLNSSIEALDWDDIDAELAECGADAFARELESLKNSLIASSTTISQIEIPTDADKPEESTVTEGIQEVPVEAKAEVTVKANVEDDKPESEYGSGDTTSNAPVLDDGPIWSKGSKNYKAVENRRMNQILTIGVILSLVLATGIGLGNLAAVNECEEELKVASRPADCSCDSGKPFQYNFRQDHREQVIPAASNPKIFVPKPNPFKMDNSEVAGSDEEILPFMPPRRLEEFSSREERAKWSDPIGEFGSPLQELSKLVQMIDSLSEKFKHFGNNTENIASRRNAEEYFKRTISSQVEKVRDPKGIFKNDESLTLVHGDVIPDRETEVAPEPLPLPSKAMDKLEVKPKFDLKYTEDLINEIHAKYTNSKPELKNSDLTSPEPETDFADTEPEPLLAEPEPEPDRKPTPKGEEGDKATQKRYKFKKNKNAKDKAHKEHEKSKKYDSKSEKFQKNVKRQKRNRNSFQDHDNSKKQNSVQENKSNGIKIDENKTNKNQEKVKPEKVHKYKHKAYGDGIASRQWDALRAKAREEARMRDLELKQKKSWYFDRVKGREKFRH